MSDCFTARTSAIGFGVIAALSATHGEPALAQGRVTTPVVPAQCVNHSVVNRVPLSVFVDDSGSVRSDGHGSYDNGVDNVGAVMAYKASGLRVFYASDATAHATRALRI